VLQRPFQALQLQRRDFIAAGGFDGVELGAVGEWLAAWFVSSLSSYVIQCSLLPFVVSLSNPVLSFVEGHERRGGGGAPFNPSTGSGRTGLRVVVAHTRSTIMAMPWPTPMHMVAKP
jgi:hypothetical protein